MRFFLKNRSNSNLAFSFNFQISLWKINISALQKNCSVHWPIARLIALWCQPLIHLKPITIHFTLFFFDRFQYFNIVLKLPLPCGRFQCWLQRCRWLHPKRHGAHVSFTGGSCNFFERFLRIVWFVQPSSQVTYLSVQLVYLIWVASNFLSLPFLNAYHLVQLQKE